MKSDNKTCGICFDNILSTGKINSCEHDFHYKCIARWSRISSNCPTCRVSFTEICHIKCGKLLKKIRINEDYHTTEEDISNSDIEEWQAACSICMSTSPEFLLACEGASGCSKVVHSYCLTGTSLEHWVCDECENEGTESLASEESSIVESERSEEGSDPDEEYEPKVESGEGRRTSNRLAGRGRELMELKSDSDSFIESDSDDFSEDKSFSEDGLVPTRRSTRIKQRTFSSSSNSPSEKRLTRRSQHPIPHQSPPIHNEPFSASIPSPKPLRRLKRNNEPKPVEINLPSKRSRAVENCKEELAEFITTETKAELERFQMERINFDRLVRILTGIISRNERLNNISDPRTVQKIRTVIRTHIAGLV